MWPPANTMTIRAAPIASGAITPAGAPMPVQPIVRTRKNVPMNSAMYLFISGMLKGSVKGGKRFSWRSELEKPNDKQAEHGPNKDDACPHIDFVGSRLAFFAPHIFGDNHRCALIEGINDVVGGGAH